MVRCCVTTCGAVYVKGTPKSFFRVPQPHFPNRNVPEERIMAETRRECWIKAINNPNFDSLKCPVVCSDHFVSGKPADFRDDQNPDWVPSLNLPAPSTADDIQVKEEDVEQQEEDQQDNNISYEFEFVDCSKLATPAYIDNNNKSSSNGNKSTAASYYEEEISRLRNRVAELESKLNERSRRSSRTADFFQRCMDSPQWMSYYTNMCPKTFLEFYETLQPTIKIHKLAVMSPEEQLFMTLVKMRLDLTDSDLAFRFDVDQSTISRYTRRWVRIIKSNRQYIDMVEQDDNRATD